MLNPIYFDHNKFVLQRINCLGRWHSITHRLNWLKKETHSCDVRNELNCFALFTKCITFRMFSGKLMHIPNQNVCKINRLATTGYETVLHFKHSNFIHSNYSAFFCYVRCLPLTFREISKQCFLMKFMLLLPFPALAKI